MKKIKCCDANRDTLKGELIALLSELSDDWDAAFEKKLAELERTAEYAYQDGVLDATESAGTKLADIINSEFGTDFDFMGDVR